MTVRARRYVLADAQGYEEKAQLLLQAICEEALKTGSRRIERDVVAPSIGITRPL
jgi:hypothetical protein